MVTNEEKADDNLIRYEDIRGKLSSYIQDIHNQQETTDTNFNQIFTDVQNVQDAINVDIIQANSKLEDRKTLLEQTATKTIQTAYNLTDQSAKQVEQNTNFLGSVYKKMVVPIIGLTVLIVLYSLFDLANDVFLLPSLIITISSYNISLLNLILAVVSIALCYSIYRSYRKLKIDLSNRKNSVEALKKDINNLKYEPGNVRAPVIPTKDLKPILDFSHRVCEAFVSTMVKSVPVVDKAFEEVSLIARYRETVDSFLMALRYYNLYHDESIFESIKVGAPIHLHIITNNAEWEISIAEIIAEKLKEIYPSVTPEVILLLYIEHNGYDSRSTYREICSSSENLGILSEILLRSHILVKPSNGIDYKNANVIACLKSLNNYNLSDINNKLLKHYELLELYKKSLQQYKIPVDDRIYDIALESSNMGQNELEKNTAQKVVAYLANTGITVSPQIIYLLFCSHIGRDTRSLYREICNSEEELQQLGRIVITHELLIESPNHSIANIGDVSALLKNARDFNLYEINEKLWKIFRISDYLNSYKDFLQKQGLTPSNFDFQFIISCEEVTLEDAIITLCYDLGKRSFQNILQSEDEWISDGFAKASLSIKFHSDYSIRERACRISACDEAVAIIKAYFEKSEEYDRKSMVKLGELTNQIDLVTMQFSKREEEDFKFLKGLLADGQWRDSYAAIIKEYFEKHSEEVKAQLSQIQKFTILQDVLKEHFKKVNINTVDKAIDAQLFSAYIILFQSNRGSLKRAINTLSIRKLDDEPVEHKWHLKSLHEVESIKRKYGVTQVYDYINFSDSTRIGFLKKGITFERFKERYLEDLMKVLKVDSDNGETFDIGVVIHKITPSRYSLGNLDDLEDDDPRIAVKSLDIAGVISRLASYYLPPEEQASIIKFESDVDILEIVNHKTIYEIIKTENDDLSEREMDIIKSDEFKSYLIESISNKFGVRDIKSLAIEVNSGRIPRNNADKILTPIFHTYISSQTGTKRFPVERASIFSKRLLDAIEGLTLIYELQRR